MPSKSPAQHRLMEAVAHSPAVAKKTGVPQAVGKEFAAADAHRKAKVAALRKPKKTPGVKGEMMGDPADYGPVAHTVD